MLNDVFKGRSPVARESLDRRAANALRDAILTGALLPGSRLTETAISEQFGLSRGTIRAALQRLVAEGLVVQNMYSSWEVVRLSSKDAWELYTLRGSLERLAGRLAAANMTEPNKILLTSAFNEMVDVAKHGTSKDLADADLNFHLTIFKISDHKRLVDHFTQVKMQLRICIASVNGFMSSPVSIIKEHEPLVEALLKGDLDRSSSLLEQHCNFYGSRLVDLLKIEEASCDNVSTTVAP